MDKSKILKFKNILQLKNNLVGILFTDKCLNIHSKRDFVCCAIKKASEGESFCFTKKNTLCNIGSYFLGFSDKPSDDEFNLVEKEKIFSSYEVARSFYLNTPQPSKNPHGFIYITPLEKLDNTCDLILLISNPLQISIILGLLAYSEGTLDNLSFYGPLCQTAITSPLIKNKISISFLDFSSRCEANFKNEEQVLSIPYRYFHILLQNVECSNIAKKLKSKIL